MRLRTLALALALSCGAATVMQAAGQKTYKAKHYKPKKYKQSKAAKVKPRKAPKHKMA